MHPTTLGQIIKFRSICLCGQPTILESGNYSSGDVDHAQKINRFDCDNSKLPIELSTKYSPAIIANFNYTIDLLNDRFKITDVVYTHYKSAKVGPANEFIKRYMKILKMRMELVCSNECRHESFVAFDVSFQLKKNYNSPEGSLIDVVVCSEKFNVYSEHSEFDVRFWPKDNKLRVWPKVLKTGTTGDCMLFEFTPEQFEKIPFTQQAWLNKLKLWTLLT